MYPEVNGDDEDDKPGMAYNPATGKYDIPIINHSDGSTTYQFGAMVGDVKYDKYGNE